MVNGTLKNSWIPVFLFIQGSLLVIGLSVCIRDRSTAPKTLHYPSDLIHRSRFIGHVGEQIYLDNTGASTYPDQLLNEIQKEMSKNGILDLHPLNGKRESLLETAENEILQLLGTNRDSYKVIFTASATQSLKLVAESFNWKHISRFFYTRVNHNSVIGIRSIALRNGAQFKCIGDFESLSSLKGTDEDMVAFPLEDNFAGTKPTKEAIQNVLKSGVFTVADASAYLPTNPLNLTVLPFDAVVLSFYKIFGFPNVGALIVRQENIPKRKIDPEKLISVIIGTRLFRDLGVQNIQKHVWNMTQRLYNGLVSMKHAYGSDVFIIYGNHKEGNPDIQGGIVSFNIVRPDGTFEGYASVVEAAGKANIHLRGGCHCNPGFCFQATGLSEDKVKAYFDKKTTCGDKYDVVDGIPLGAVRASIGWSTTEKDIDGFLKWLERYIS